MRCGLPGKIRKNGNEKVNYTTEIGDGEASSPRAQRRGSRWGSDGDGPGGEDLLDRKIVDDMASIRESPYFRLSV